MSWIDILFISKPNERWYFLENIDARLLAIADYNSGNNDYIMSKKRYIFEDNLCLFKSVYITDFTKLIYN